MDSSFHHHPRQSITHPRLIHIQLIQFPRARHVILCAGLSVVENCTVLRYAMENPPSRQYLSHALELNPQRAFHGLPTYLPTYLS